MTSKGKVFFVINQTVAQATNRRARAEPGGRVRESRNQQKLQSIETQRQIKMSDVGATPYQQWVDRIQRVMKQENATGWITIRGTDDWDFYDDNSSDEEYDGESSPYTTKEVNHIRAILLSPERERAVDKMTKLIIGVQYSSTVKVLEPCSFASHVLSTFRLMETEFKNYRLWSKKFDILFGYTSAIARYDAWLDGNDDGQMNDMVNDIFDMWERVMKRSSSDLGIDDEFSRPGVECFLRKFEDNVGYIG